MNKSSYSERKDAAKNSVSQALKTLGTKLSAAKEALDKSTLNTNITTATVAATVAYKYEAARTGVMEYSQEAWVEFATVAVSIAHAPSRTLVGACLSWLKAKVVRIFITPITHINLWAANTTNPVGKVVVKCAHAVRWVYKVATSVVALTIGLAWWGVRLLAVATWRVVRYLPSKVWSYIQPPKPMTTSEPSIA